MAGASGDRFYFVRRRARGSPTGMAGAPTIEQPREPRPLGQTSPGPGSVLQSRLWTCLARAVPENWARGWGAVVGICVEGAGEPAESLLRWRARNSRGRLNRTPGVAGGKTGTPLPYGFTAQFGDVVGGGLLCLNFVIVFFFFVVVWFCSEVTVFVTRGSRLTRVWLGAPNRCRRSPLW